MALNNADVQLWQQLSSQGAIPPTPDLLEIGEANWHGSTPPPEGCEGADSWETARKFYEKTLGFKSRVAVDMQGPTALRLDLNQPLPLGREFDVIVNTGTAEHVFDQRQLFQSIHELCRPGGLMIHAAPWEGWTNHGFVNYQPCFWQDLGAANGYETLTRLLWKSPHGTMFYVAFRKTHDADFAVPMQGRLMIPSRNGKITVPVCLT